MNNREIWGEHNFKFGRIDPTPWVLFYEEPSYLTKLWRKLTSWVYTR